MVARRQITLRKCKLVVARGGVLSEHTFEKDVITVGAMDDNDIVLDDDTVSRNHCTIRLERDSYVLDDNDSTNGTFINRVRIRSAYLTPNQVITLGSTEIRFSPIDERVRIVPSERDRFGEVIGRDRRMREIYAILEKIAPTDATVVVEGETGTGKDVVARSIHGHSRRKDGPFMVFDCGAVPENLIESELFGHEKWKLHRRALHASGRVRACERRHRVPRRARRAAARSPAEAPARARAARDQAHRWHQADQGRRAHPRRDQPATSKTRLPPVDSARTSSTV